MTVDMSIYQERVEKRHKQMLWTRFTTAFLGLWLLANTFTFQHNTTPLFFSDLLCGILLTTFGIYSIREKNRWAVWGTCAVGLWMQLAPLFFWADSAYGYFNDTVVGALALALSIIIPGTPGVVEVGPEIPEGWSYNPSSWPQRIPVLTQAFLCWVIARFMAAYQLGYIDAMPDPLFGDGTLNVITSDISHAFPVSDAGLGAFVYTLETLLSAQGSTRRWHTRPWMMIFLGFLIVPAGVVSVLLIILQPLVVGYWCFWCLLTVVFMLGMIAFILDEVMASVQFLMEETRRGEPFWQTFWFGAKLEKDSYDEKVPDLDAPMKELLPAMGWGTNFPMTLVVSTLIGVWLMFSTPFLETVGGTKIVNELFGALIATVAVIAMAEVGRAARFVNIFFGAIIFLSPLIFTTNTVSLTSNLIAGLLLIGLSIPKGKIHERYGELERWIF